MKILFVCLGNICRSPMAEGLFLHHVRKIGMESQISADSCGTGNWHAGELPDKRMRETAEKNGIRLTHKARQLKENDFEIFDHILVMDESNYKDVLSKDKKRSGKVKLITELSDTHKGKIVPDPYFGDISDFESVFNLLNSISEEIVQNISKQYR